MREYLARGETPFFRLSSVKQHLSELASAPNLVVYCGAGVTIDQTGMGWVEMLRKTFSEQAEGIQVAADSRQMNWPQIASGLFERRSAATDDDMQDWLTVTLRQLLYPSDGQLEWQSGPLADSVASLVVIAALVGKAVTLVSTNYDTHLESRVNSLIEEAASEVTVTITTLLDEVPAALTPKRGHVEIVYLHGRVPPDGPAEGRVVITEQDYAETRDSSRNLLTNAMNAPDTGLLLLGASLTDPPLVDALAETHLHSPNESVRVALFPVMPTGIYKLPDYRDALDLMKARGDHLGLEILFPDFLFQVPEFCKELTYSLSPSGRGDHLEGNGRYGARLDRWWGEYRVHLTEPDVVGGFMGEKLSELLGVIATGEGENELGYDTELFRLDLWLRDSPRERQLVQWGSSIGPLRDTKLHKTEPLTLNSKHVTTQGFMSGRPRLMSLEDVGISDDETHRWKTFLVVPVFDQTPIDSDTYVNTPVGASTLCGTAEKGNSRLVSRAINSFQ